MNRIDPDQSVELEPRPVSTDAPTPKDWVRSVRALAEIDAGRVVRVARRPIGERPNRETVTDA